MRRSPDIIWYLPCLSQFSCKPKPRSFIHSFVCHCWIHKYRIHRYVVSVRRSCRQWEISLSDLSRELSLSHDSITLLSIKVIQWLRKRGTFTVNGADGGASRCVIPNLRGHTALCLRDPEPLPMEWVCLIVLSGRFCMSSNYNLTIPRRYMQ